jgi:lipopolysaccharide/colanic/teichoic acid biosynthesis glycosyltransferase
MGERSRELVILLVGDMLLFLVALWVTLFVRYLEIPKDGVFMGHFYPFLWLSVIWILVFYIAGLYDKHTVFLKSVLMNRIINTQLLNILIAAIFFIVVPSDIAPKTNLVIYLVISSGFILWWRLRLFTLFSPKKHHKALLIASGAEAEELVREVNNNERYNYTFVKMVDDEIALSTPDFEKKLLDVVSEERISMIVANPRSVYMEQLLPVLFDMTFLRFQFTFLDFYKVYEDTFDRVPLSSLRYDWFLEHISQSSSLFYDFAKRLIDMLGSLILGMVFICILPIIYIAMRIEGRGEFFIRQERIGRFNKPVSVYKIRTMTMNDAASSTWTDEDRKKGNQITKVGAVLRKLSIDEIPQVWTILKGDMSLIGPRNDIVGLGSRLASEIPYYNIRNFVKPGVTGWAQTHQHYMGDNISPQSIEENRLRLAYDLYYVKNRSLLLDISIALRTFKTVLSRFGLTIRIPR